MSGRPSVSPRCAEAITPAAGPDSTMKTGRTAGGIGAEDAAARLHHEQLRLHARLGEPALDPLQVALDDRPDDRVDHGRRGPQVLAELRRHLGRERDRDPGQLLGEDLADALLVLRVDVGVEQADGDRLDALAPEDRGGVAHRLVLERPQHLALRAEPLGRRRRRGRAARAAPPSRTACRRASGAPGARSRAGRGSPRS